MGATRYTIIITTISERLAVNAAISVSTVAIGISVRSNRMLRMIDLRAWIAPVALVTVAITSWKGTTEHARLRPGAGPARWSTNVTSTRYTPTSA